MLVYPTFMIIRNNSFLFFLSWLIGITMLKAQSAVPTIGVPTFASNVEMAEGSLLLLGEAAERGLSENEGFKIVDRRRLDAVFLAREEVRNEDYLASDRESIAALGADYLLVGRVLSRKLEPRQRQSPEGLPTKTVSLRYRIRMSLLDVRTGQLMKAENCHLEGFLSTQAGEPEMDAPLEVLVAQVERKAAAQLAKQVRRFTLRTFQAGMQVVDVLHESKNKINEVLVATTMPNFSGQELKLYINEYYVVSGDTLARPIILAEARVRRKDDRLLECKVLRGSTLLYDAREQGQVLFAVPGDQKSHWLTQMMFFGLVD